MANRRQFITQLTMAAGAATIMRPLQLFAGADSSSIVHSNTLSIFHINSLQGQLKALPAGHRLYGFGGLQQVAQHLSEIKKRHPFALFIHTGSLVGNRKSEEAQTFAGALKLAGFDAFVPDRLGLTKKESSFLPIAVDNGLPILPANGSAGNALLPFTVISKGGFQIGLIDATAIGLRTARLEAGIINETAAMLKIRQRCALVGCVVPAALNHEASLASLTRNVDIVFCTKAKTTPYNTDVVCNSEGQEVYLSYAGKQGSIINRLDLTLTNKNQKAGFATTAIFTGASEKDYAAILKKQLQAAS